MSGDGKDESIRTYRLLAELGQAYSERRQYRDAASIYKDLLSRDRRSEMTPLYEARLAGAKAASGQSK